MKDVLGFPLEYRDTGRKDEIWEFDLKTWTDEEGLMLPILDAVALAVLSLLTPLWPEGETELRLKEETETTDTTLNFVLGAFSEE